MTRPPNNQMPAELAADVRRARDRARVKALELLAPVLEVQPNRTQAFHLVLDLLASGSLSAVDLDSLRHGWTSAMARYREDEKQPCAHCARLRSKKVPSGQHCVPCAEYNMCSQCADRHAACSNAHEVTT